MRFHSWLIIAAVVLLLANCAAPVVTPTATATIPPTPTSGVDPCLATAKTYKPGSLLPGRIAFNCYSDPNVINIYTFYTTSGMITNLTHNGSTNGDIQWSPDGLQIAFYSNLDSHPGTYLMNADGSQSRWLFDGSIPRWSPDGKRIAFMRDYIPYMMNVDDEQQNQISTNLIHQMAWSSNAKQLAFSANSDGIHVINADGTHKVKLTSHSADFGDLAWSPDGSHIYFLSAHGGPLELYQVGTSDGQLTRLASAPEYIDFFALSPDGTKIVFRDDSNKVYIMNSDGSQVRQLLDTYPNYLSWSPDNQYLTFAYDQLAAVKVETGQIITLTDSSATIDYPEWSPK
jgi:Tol biopolymer transport system component